MELLPNQVWVFGSNATGFHGCGGAGLACRGESYNTWRRDEWFLKAMQAPAGSPDRIGKWAIYGVARGYMEGSEGKSYAIQTIQKPGKKRSTSLQEIQKQLAEMWDFSAAHPELQFILTPIGEGYAGYSHKEMQEVWDWIKANKGERPNWSWLADMRDRAAMT